MLQRDVRDHGQLSGHHVSDLSSPLRRAIGLTGLTASRRSRWESTSTVAFGPTFADFVCVDALTPYPNGVPLSVVVPTVVSASAMSSGSGTGYGGGGGGGGGVVEIGVFRGTRGTKVTRGSGEAERRSPATYVAGIDESVFSPLLELYAAIFRR